MNEKIMSHQHLGVERLWKSGDGGCPWGGDNLWRMSLVSDNRFVLITDLGYPAEREKGPFRLGIGGGWYFLLPVRIFPYRKLKIRYPRYIIPLIEI